LIHGRVLKRSLWNCTSRFCPELRLVLNFMNIGSEAAEKSLSC
jgi:hypothetical protein